jgi:CubicO group peptidase (beta-lactamase class C family)
MPRDIDGRSRPLRAETVALMGEDHTGGMFGNDDGQVARIHHGLGWSKPTLNRRWDAPGSSKVVAHGGASGTQLWIDPDARLVFVFFSNLWSPDRRSEYEAITGTYEALQP